MSVSLPYVGQDMKNIGKCMKNALYSVYVLWYAKMHLSGWSNVEQWKIKPITLAVIELRLSEGISQFLIQSVILSQ